MSASVYLLATRSAGKLRELRPLFTAAGLRIVDLDEAGIPEDEAEQGIECYEAFEENALAKARWFSTRSGLPTIADDSGLEVHALGGAPGVQSRRWSDAPGLTGTLLDEANNTKLLGALERHTDRRARYVCVAALVGDGRELVRRGETTGRILAARASGPHGFGYDPFFFSDALGRSFADVPAAEKERVSHRGRAFRALLEAMGARP